MSARARVVGRPKIVEVIPGINVTPRGTAVIAGTRVRTAGIFTAFIYRAASIKTLRRRYKVLPWQIEQAIRWEARGVNVRMWLLVKARREA